jgi:hypothetical protein
MTDDPIPIAEIQATAGPVHGWPAPPVAYTPYEPPVGEIPPISKPPKPNWSVVSLVVLSVALVAAFAVIAVEHGNTATQHDHAVSLSSSLSDTQSSLSATSDDLTSTKHDLTGALAQADAAQRNSTQAHAAGQLLDQCVQDVGVFLQDISVELSTYTEDPAVTAESTRVGNECSEARQAFASLGYGS